jgi:hypothetical protein
VLAYFGWPAAHEDDAERAVRAGLAAVAAVARLEAPGAGPLSARVGLATGSVVVGEVLGEGEARERGVVGETPNLAARLQALAEPGAVVLDEATRRLTGALFDYADLDEAALKGVPGPARAWRALGESAVESRFEALRTGAHAAPLVGRTEELGLLLRRWRRARSGEGQVVLLRGEAGIGKSRLVAALQEALAGEEREELVLYCSPQHTDSALRPMISRLERAAGLALGEPPKARLAKLEALLAPLDPPPEDVALVAELLSVPTLGRWPVLGLAPQRRRERLLAALLRRVRALAARRPALVVVEDAHWVDPTTRELLDLLVKEMPGMALLLVVTHRREFDAGAWLEQPHVTLLHLSRLGRVEHAALLRRIAGGKALPADVEAEILACTDGVPLFVEEVTRAVLEGGLLREEADRWVLEGPLPPLAVPVTLQASLVARLDRLSSVREVAQAGAVLGREFAYDLLIAVSGLPEARLRGALAQLERGDLVRRRGAPPEAVYAFKHALVQEAAYGTLLRERRRALHARAAEVIERLRPEVADREPEMLAHHCERAGLAEVAVGHYRRAGERSVARFANREAIGHFQRALELLERLGPGEERDRLEAELRLAQAVPLIAIHGHGSEAVEACALRAGELGERLPGWDGRFAAHRLAWNSCNLRQPIPRAVALARDLLSSAEGTGEPARSAVACRALGFSLFLAGELAEADPVVERGLALADGLADAAFAAYGEDPRVVCRIHRGQIRSLMGQPETALRLAEEGLARARACGNPPRRRLVAGRRPLLHPLAPARCARGRAGRSGSRRPRWTAPLPAVARPRAAVARLGAVPARRRGTGPGAARGGRAPAARDGGGAAHDQGPMQPRRGLPARRQARGGARPRGGGAPARRGLWRAVLPGRDPPASRRSPPRPRGPRRGRREAPARCAGGREPPSGAPAGTARGHGPHPALVGSWAHRGSARSARPGLRLVRRGLRPARPARCQDAARLAGLMAPPPSLFPKTVP